MDIDLNQMPYEKFDDLKVAIWKRKLFFMVTWRRVQNKRILDKIWRCKGLTQFVKQIIEELEIIGIKDCLDRASFRNRFIIRTLENRNENKGPKMKE